MKHYTLTLGQSIGYRHEHPERTASRESGWDRYYQVWPNRASMAKTIRLQEKGVNFYKAYKAVIPLTPGEGH